MRQGGGPAGGGRAGGRPVGGRRAGACGVRARVRPGSGQAAARGAANKSSHVRECQVPSMVFSLSSVKFVVRALVVFS